MLALTDACVVFVEKRCCHCDEHVDLARAKSVAPINKFKI